VTYETTCIRCDEEIDAGPGTENLTLTFHQELGAVAACAECKEAVFERDYW